MDERQLDPDLAERLGTPIDEFVQSARALSALTKLKVRTLADVLEYSPESIGNLRGVGPGTMEILHLAVNGTDEPRWGTDAKYTPWTAPVTPRLGQIGDKHPAALEAELPLAMETMFGIPRGLLRPKFIARLKKAIKDNHPEINPSPITALFERNGESPFFDIPLPVREAFERRMRLLNLLHVVVQAEGGT